MDRWTVPPLRVAILLLATAVAAAGCGDSASPADTEDGVPSGTVVLYTSMPLPIVERLEGVFEGAFPDIEGDLWIAPGAAEAGGIDLEIVRGRTGDIQERIADELASGGIGADVIWLAEPSPYEEYAADGLLAPYSPPAEAPIPEALIDREGFYVAGRIINMVVAWNTDLRPEGLRDWTQLLEAQNAVFPGPGSGAARAAIKALSEAFGDDFFARFVAAGGSQVDDNGTARDRLVEGSHDAAGVLDYMIRLARQEGSHVDLAYPESGTVIIPSPIAVTAAAANPAAARVFVDFVLSRQGQQIVVEIGSFYPVRTDVAPPSGAPPLDEITALEIDWSELAAETESIDQMWTQLFGE